jgi:polyhydroxyalkanoate synthesis regulator phasin
MWISKKKLEHKLRKAENDAWFKHSNEQDEITQWERIEKLEKQVKKLKQQIKEGY